MPGYHYLEAMLFAIDKINNDTSILPNVTLGARIYDSCRSQTVGAKMTKELITMAVFPPDSGEQLAGVIGAHSSDLSKVVADFLRVFEIPQVSYGSTATLLSDKSIYSYFFRTIPPDNLQARAMAEVVVKLGWNFVITINSDGVYGKLGMEQFHKAAMEHGICIALKLSLSSFPTEHELDRLVHDLDREPLARGVVLFTLQRDARLILKAFARNPTAKRFFWIASDSWGNNVDVTNGGLEHWAEGAITLTQFNKPIRGFDEYFRRLNAKDERLSNNAWSQQFWQNHFNCSLNGSVSGYGKNCSGNESLSSAIFHFAPVQTVVNAVYAMAHALHNYMRDRCTRGACGVSSTVRQPIDRSKLVSYLRNITFIDQATGKRVSFNKHQEISGGYSIFNFQKTNEGYDYKEVGVWKSDGELELEVTKLRWPNHSVNTSAVSRCSKPCHHGDVRRRKDEHDIVCCWKCVPCASGAIIMNDTCVRCPSGYSPDARLVECVKFPAVVLFSRSSSKAILAVSLLGQVCVTVVAVIFFKFSHVPLIKASSRELSGIILFGLSLLLLSAPSHAICVAQLVILGVALASCYAPLFMKILRIYRIFAGAKKSVNKPFLVSPTSQVLIAISLILIQCLFGAISFFSDVPAPLERVISDGRKILVECSLERKMFVSLLSYNMLLMAMCTVMAFKTRRFPRNFNEAKYIGFTMYFTCFVWIIFFPFYLNSDDGLARIKWEASAVLSIGWITLIGLFGPKIYFLLQGHVGSESDDRRTITASHSMTDASVLRVDSNAVTPTNIRRNIEEDDGNESKNEKLRSLSDA